ncbi:alpha-amylase [Anaerococcus hydrogenalis]|uniref:Alpha-amylase n=1 Tax=Anaerococcus hydrogenalis TaxID=33029 RepID=A0A2N6UID1_9FIRM|nr:alpha-amylase [Anaerococcus hydrogenalis]MDK7694781.1 alpha-amylase [Anaerococcus hydrogenalis]MDK7696665.1 alpha-amylase [Anaerococcus hydrogenalis]MDK7707808.1 alpha-amylase [Anaerococcus hydrogenalis]PMC81418.1 alpha-amylase [Anaerococcus hydrogenalis]
MSDVMMQAFEWDTPADGGYYKFLKENAKKIKDAGIDALWLPPMCKGGGDQDVGYGIYDLWDLGEFDQKGTVRTKYGTKKELLEAIDELHKNEIKVYADVVLNHKGNADFEEEFMARMVDQNNREKDVSEDMKIKAWTGFNFPGRAGKYSDFVWHYYHFTGVDYDANTDTKAIFRILGDGKYWDEGVSDEKGNFDYLMNADIDHSHPEVREEIFKWVDWFMEETGVDGFRYDALKHISDEFIYDLSKHIMEKKKDDFYLFGEYWQYDEGQIDGYLDDTDWKIDLFDVPLHFHMQEASKSNGNYDMRNIFNNTIVENHPLQAVTFVDNHDSQPGQSLDSWVEDWFKEIAYSLILFRKDGYPCIFAGDYYGLKGEIKKDPLKEMIDKMLDVRKKYSFGDQDEYFDNPQVVGWVRRTDNETSSLAVLISIGDMAEKQMFVGEEEAGKVYIDLSGNNKNTVTIDEDGNGVFNVGPGSVSYWAAEEN